MAAEIEIVERLPSVEEYQDLRREAGWPEVADEAVRRGFEGGLYGLVVLKGGRVIGCGRVVGDGGMYFYLQDIIVRPEYQGQGVGRAIMDRLMDFIAGQAGRGSQIGLLAAAGKAGFYERWGFSVRTPERPGMDLVWSGGPGEAEERE